MRSASLKKVVSQKTVTSLVVNAVSKLCIFLQVLQNFRNTALYKTISKSEHMLSPAKLN